MAGVDLSTLPRVLAVGAVMLALVIGVIVGLRVARDDSPGPSSVDVRFLQDMTIHHEQAVAMSWVAIRNGASSPVRGIAVEIITNQQREIGIMAALIEGFDQSIYPNRQTVMEWMGPPFPAAEMPGLASIEELDELGLLEGPALDRMFLELMIDHHLGGTEMAGFAETEATTPEVRELAELMDHVQTVEIGQMERLLDVFAGSAT